LKEADAAEMCLIEKIRRMGQEAMQAWANRQNEITEQEIRRGGQVQREGKKNSAGTPPFGDISVDEPQLRRGSQRVRAPLRKAPKLATEAVRAHYNAPSPTLESINPFPRSWTNWLSTTALFWARAPFAALPEEHAQKIFEMADKPLAWPTKPDNSASRDIVEMDAGWCPS